MKQVVLAVLALFVLALWASASASVEESRPAINEALVREINADPQSSWVAGENENFRGLSIKNVKTLLGWKPDPSKKAAPKKFPDMGKELPTNFTSADQWSDCTIIGTIWNQARCGSCWAFGGVAAASDRMCIASKGKFNQVLSFGQVTECSSGGCDGGAAEDTWGYLTDPGVVTGSCYPYYIPTCAPQDQPCLNFVDTPDCWSNNSCVDGGDWKTYNFHEQYAINSVNDAMTDIMTNGPIEACFDVYEDFLQYKSGVYYHKSGGFLGGHCVKVQGWGEENGMPYWLINNSWTTAWGDKGQFKIVRGKDDCGIEDNLVAGLPKWQ